MKGATFYEAFYFSNATLYNIYYPKPLYISHIFQLNVLYKAGCTLGFQMGHMVGSIHLEHYVSILGFYHELGYHLSFTGYSTQAILT